MTTTEPLTPEQEWEKERAEACDPSTPIKKLINLARGFPWEVYNNEALPLHKLADLSIEAELHRNLAWGVFLAVYGITRDDPDDELQQSVETCTVFPERFNRFLDDAASILEEYIKHVDSIAKPGEKEPPLIKKALAWARAYPKIPLNAVSKRDAILKTFGIEDSGSLFTAPNYHVSGVDVDIPPFVDFLGTLESFMRSTCTKVNKYAHDIPLPDIVGCEPGSEMWRRELIGTMRIGIPWRYQHYVLLTMALEFADEEEKPLINMLIEKERNEILERQKKELQVGGDDDETD